MALGIKKYLFFLIYNRCTQRLGQRIPALPRKFIKHLRYKLSLRLNLDWHQINMIFVETITACNLRCHYCPNSLYDRGLIKNMKKMKAEVFYKIIDELSALGWTGELQPHSYGEPLLDDRLEEFIAYAKRKIKGLRINLFTNGELLNLDIYEKLIAAGVDAFTVTQHLPAPAGGVLAVLAYREEFGADNVSFCYRRLEEISNRGGLVAVKDGVQLNTCTYPCSNLGIDYAGNVLLCCHDYLQEVKIGNVADEKLISIWQKPAYKKIREDMEKGVFSLAICQKCKIGKVIGMKDRDGNR